VKDIICLYISRYDAKNIKTMKRAIKKAACQRVGKMIFNIILKN
jgi:vacuolar-type H+-ATPase subunit C/Vma6